MSAPLIIDLHLDLAWDALFWNRDLTLTAQQVRDQEESEKHTTQKRNSFNQGHLQLFVRYCRQTPNSAQNAANQLM